VSGDLVSYQGGTRELRPLAVFVEGGDGLSSSDRLCRPCAKFNATAGLGSMFLHASVPIARASHDHIPSYGGLYLINYQVAYDQNPRNSWFF